jgi:hypothetical protein
LMLLMKFDEKVVVVVVRSGGLMVVVRKMEGGRARGYLWGRGGEHCWPC